MVLDWQDVINGSIELCGCVAVLASARRVCRDRGARGIHSAHVGYALAVNYWSVYYYWYIAQPFSFACGIAFAVAVSLWAGLIYKHSGDFDDRTG